ncbi:unnamed protein product, partial [Allacma fusca]
MFSSGLPDIRTFADSFKGKSELFPSDITYVNLGGPISTLHLSSKCRNIKIERKPDTDVPDKDS